MSIIPFFICKFFFGQNFCKKLLYFFHLFKSFCQKFYGFFYAVRYILVLPHALFILLHFFLLNFHAFSLYSIIKKKEKVFLLYNPKHLFPLISSTSFTNQLHQSHRMFFPVCRPKTIRILTSEAHFSVHQ